MPIYARKIFHLFYLICFLSTSTALAIESDVKVAVVHFQPHFQQVSSNVGRMLQLAEEAGSNEAKIVIFPEMATSGYSYFNKEQICQVAEKIPGRTTEFFSDIARRYAMYIVVGLPEYDGSSNLFYNSAVLINPNGEIGGVYRKHSHLMESSWSALGTGQVPVFETIYGKLAILICADINYSELSAQVSSKETKFLILPTNGGININLLKARAIEGQCHIILSNRYGNEREEYLISETLESFNEETLTLTPPFFYDFQDGKSLIINSNGEIKVILENANDSIGYCDLPLDTNRIKVMRRPELYGLLAQNTLDPYSIKCMRLPDSRVIQVAAANLQSKNLKELLVDIKGNLQKLSKQYFFFGNGLKLVVFPANVLRVSPTEIQEIDKQLRYLAGEYGVDFVIGFQEIEEDHSSSTSYLFTNEQKSFYYKKLHKLSSETTKIGEHFTVVNRNYGRVAIVQDKDLWVPETSKVLEKMGVDIVAVCADEADEWMRIFCKARSLDYLHIVMANRKGVNGIYAGGFKTFPYVKEAEGVVMMELDIEHVREKKELRIGFDHESILKQAQ